MVKFFNYIVSENVIQFPSNSFTQLYKYMYKISQVQYISIDFKDCPKPMAVTVNEQTYIYNDPDSFNVMEFGVK